MPIATPEVYAEMLDRAKAGAFAYPAINVTSSQTLNAALQGFAEAGSDGIVQVSTGGAEYLSGATIKDMVLGRPGAGRVRAPRGQGVPGEHRAAHRPLPQGQAGRLHAAADQDLAGAGRGRAGAAVPVAHVGRLGGRAGGEPEDRPRAARGVREGEDRDGARDRRGRRRGGRRRQRDQREAVHDAGRRGAHRRGARCPRRGRALPAGRDLRQRARGLQAGQRQAAAVDPQGHPGRGRRQARRGQAVRPGVPRRLGLGPVRRSARPSTTAS